MNARAFCYACGTALGLAAFTGGALALDYVPSESHAWLSVLGVNQAFGGGFVRGLHRAAAEAAIVSGVLAVAANLASTQRQSGRARLTFLVLGLFLILALVVTGNPLRNDNAGRFALSVEVNVVGSLPWFGSLARRILIGNGPDQTLMARLFARHAVLLPGLLLLVLSAAYRVRPTRAERASLPPPRPVFAPSLADLIAVLACLSLVLSSALVKGASLGAPADLDSAYPARPAWYFQPLYLARQLLPAEHAPALTLAGLSVVAMAVALLMWKALDATPSQRRRRNLAFLAGLAVYAGVAAFGVLKDARDPEVRWSLRQEQWAVQRVQALSRAGGSLKLGARHLLSNDPVHRARALFSEHCSNCHALGDLGPRDGVARAPALDGFGSRAWVLSMLDTPDAAHRFGNTPYAGQMQSFTHPPADPALRAAFKPMPLLERQAVAEYLSAQATTEEPSVAAPAQALGERLVRERCTSCHLFAGKTDDAESRAPELLGWASPAWTYAQILNPNSGRTYRAGPRARGEMPSFGGVLSQEEVALLVDLIRGALPKDAPVKGYQALGDVPPVSGEGG
ncbi:MAG TPA: c-type cytochrome [Polyangiaceae bacterium]|nr:c-type cytochrome [Polyangiaceae bacterium]